MSAMKPTLALLLLVLVTREGPAQAAGLPPQCDPEVVMYPVNMAFMGAAKSIQAGKAPTFALRGRRP